MKTAAWAARSCKAGHATEPAKRPPEDIVADLYETAAGRLAARGWARYEISNFARPGHQSRHNLKYWLLEPYVGFGAGRPLL